jgi:hypothetical protein
MKYLEELQHGDCFINNKNQKFILSSDFKNNGYKLCLSLQNGYPSWISSQEIVEPLALYSLDKDNNIIAIK